MTIDRRFIKRIFAIFMTATLVYGAFFSVAMEVTYAEEVAKDEPAKVEAPKDTRKADDPSTPKESTSKGDTSKADPTDENRENSPEGNKDEGGSNEGVGNEGIGGSGNEGDDPDKANSDDQQIDKKGDQKDGEPSGEPSAPSGEGDKPAGGNEDGNNNNNNNDGNGGGSPDDAHKVLPEDEPTVKEPEPKPEESYAYTRKMTFNDPRSHVEYDIDRGLLGIATMRGFFFKFDENAFGTEYLTFVVNYGTTSETFPITHYSNGTWEGVLPPGFEIFGNDLIINWRWLLLQHNSDIDVEVIDYGLLSGISEEPDGSYYAPEYEPVGPLTQDKNQQPPLKNADSKETDQPVRATTTPSAPRDVRAVTKAIAPSIDETIKKDVANVNAVLSSYQNTSNSAVMDATKDDDSPINATTAMLAGVAAMFLITISLVVVPKV